MSDELTPITRKETFLAKAGGQNVETPTPITREETFLQAIIDNGSGGGGGGGTGGGVLKINVNEQAQMDKTWAEINEAAFSVVVGSFSEGENIWMPVVKTTAVGNVYMVILAFLQINDGSITFQETKFVAMSETDYPEATS